MFSWEASISLLFSFFDILPKSFLGWSFLCGSLPRLLGNLGVCNIFWATWKSATVFELLKSATSFGLRGKSATSSELLGSLQRLLSYLEVCNVLWTARKSATSSELLGFWVTRKYAKSFELYLEECNALWATWKSAMSSELFGSLQRLLSYLEVCNVFCAT